MLSPFKSLLLLTFIFGTVYVLNYTWYRYVDKKEEEYIEKWQTVNFLGSILTLFGSLKLLDLKGFASIFQKYDLIAMNVPSYGYLYPFIELFLGAMYFLRINIYLTHIATLIFMTISIISVLKALYSGKKLRCGCLGTFFHIPLSYVTLSENVVMSSMIVYLFTKNASLTEHT